VLWGEKRGSERSAEENLQKTAGNERKKEEILCLTRKLIRSYEEKKRGGGGGSQGGGKRPGGDERGSGVATKSLCSHSPLTKKGSKDEGGKVKVISRGGRGLFEPDAGPNVVF